MTSFETLGALPVRQDGYSTLSPSQNAARKQRQRKCICGPTRFACELLLLRRGGGGSTAVLDVREKISASYSHDIDEVLFKISGCRINTADRMVTEYVTGVREWVREVELETWTKQSIDHAANTDRNSQSRSCITRIYNHETKSSVRSIKLMFDVIQHG